MYDEKKARGWGPFGWFKRRPKGTESPDLPPTDSAAPEGPAESGDPSSAPGTAPSYAAAHDSAYKNSHEHLVDELHHLDLSIRREMLAQRRRLPENPLEQLRGLVLSDEEVDSLVVASREPGDDPAGPVTAALAEVVRQMDRRRAAGQRDEVFLTVPHLSRLFQLNRQEELILITCLAPELDRKYDKLYAYLQDDVTRKRPSIDLALRLLGLNWKKRLAARALFDPQAPLVKYRLIHIIDVAADGAQPLLARSLKLDDRIVDLLLGRRRIDVRLEPVAELVEPSPVGQSTATEEQMRRLLQTTLMAENAPPTRMVVHVRGSYGSGRRALAEAAALELGLPLLRADLTRIHSADELWLLARESFLQPAVLCLEGFDTALTEKRAADLDHFLDAVELLSQLTFLVGERAWHPHGRLRETTFLALTLPRPDDAARLKLWQKELNDSEVQDVDIGALASMFRFTPGQVRDAVAFADGVAKWRGGQGISGQGISGQGIDRQCITGDDLFAACRAQSDSDLARLARKIEPRRGWRDIVLEEDSLTQLWEICHQARYRHIVLGDWGFDRKLSYGKGLAALFSGPPGTGKTLAAEVVAGELGLELYKIDLSQIVSKYIGETEKNLDRIFNAAERANSILFFDEADALFGKRSEVRDSHDRYANVEISYLLQKMEEYEGISILATNLRKHMDEAFLRRLQNIVELPFPDARQRERIWQVTFPQETPLAGDVDFAVLGHRLRLAGGNIKNIGLLAAFYAAADGSAVGMPHLLAAARREHQKLGRTWNEQEWAAVGAPANGGSIQ